MSNFLLTSEDINPFHFPFWTAGTLYRVFHNYFRSAKLPPKIFLAKIKVISKICLTTIELTFRIFLPIIELFLFYHNEVHLSDLSLTTKLLILFFSITIMHNGVIHLDIFYHNGVKLLDFSYHNGSPFWILHSNKIELELQILGKLTNVVAIFVYSNSYHDISFLGSIISVC